MPLRVNAVSPGVVRTPLCDRSAVPSPIRTPTPAAVRGIFMHFATRGNDVSGLSLSSSS